MQRRRTQPPKILVVDDEPYIGDLLKAVIHRWRADAEVIYRSEGEAAWLESLRNEPDLLITDINRPGMNGYQLLRLLARWNVRFPVLVISGGAKEENVRKCAGQNLEVSFLEKPFSIRRFVGELSRHLGPGDEFG